MSEQPHRFQRGKVTEIPLIRTLVEHDSFIDNLSLPQKLAQIFDLSANVIQVNFSNHGKAA